MSLFGESQCYNISEILGQVSGYVSTTEVSREQLAHLSVLLIYYVGQIDSKCGTKMDATNTTVAAAHAYMTNMTATPHGIGDFLNSVKCCCTLVSVVVSDTLVSVVVSGTIGSVVVSDTLVSAVVSDTLVSVVVSDTLVSVVVSGTIGSVVVILLLVTHLSVLLLVTQLAVLLLVTHLSVLLLVTHLSVLLLVTHLSLLLLLTHLSVLLLLMQLAVLLLKHLAETNHNHTSEGSETNSLVLKEKMVLSSVIKLIPLLLLVLTFSLGTPVKDDLEPPTTIEPETPAPPNVEESVTKEEVESNEEYENAGGEQSQVVKRELSRPGSVYRITLVEKGTTRGRRAVSNTNKIWPKKIPYIIETSYRNKGIYYTIVLKRAMQYLMDRVCITLVDVTGQISDTAWLTNNGFETQSYIRITDNGK
uniref:Peptidase M12A domain-containing protein n=1 Tax=Biomphalaria glabrata TaxID=6526 RepID=A0A2C9KEC3_BIOGL